MVDESPSWNFLVGGFVFYPSLESAESARERLTGKAKAESAVWEVTSLSMTVAGKEEKHEVPNQPQDP